MRKNDHSGQSSFAMQKKDVLDLATSLAASIQPKAETTQAALQTKTGDAMRSKGHL
jgi:hypothetical protein